MTTVPVVQFTIRGQPRGPAREGIAPRHFDYGRPYTVIYDGNCKVCGKLVGVLRKWDQHECLEIIPSQTPGVAARFPWIPARAYLESVQFIEPGGRTWQGAAAIEHIIDILPKGKFVTWVFSIPFVRPLAERFYRWFARNRYKLGCGEHCQFRAAMLEKDFS
jgi:predicted DCC family thiol-disulfide oxidoreductase YuxK